jgi:hypothetical protein
MIKASSGSTAAINAIITEEDGTIISKDCKFILHSKDGEEMLEEIAGTYNEETHEWTFIISATITKNLKGRYWYCIKYIDSNLCFKQPIYFV